ncbi:hypothetical protein BJF78_30150 [Pseudonocardia sp. CNS-139]|nr:hypothetical protein BJF78_30150 [Pseudonocardia sp. CNS-139]
MSTAHLDAADIHPADLAGNSLYFHIKAAETCAAVDDHGDHDDHEDFDVEDDFDVDEGATWEAARWEAIDYARMIGDDATAERLLAEQR